MYNTYHIMYILISLSVISGLLCMFYFNPSFKKNRSAILFIIGLLCVLMHLSQIYVEYLLQVNVSKNTTRIIVWESTIFIIYPCNLTMYMLLVLGFFSLLKKENKIFKIFATGAAYAGIIGALVTLFGENTFVYSRKITLNIGIPHIFDNNNFVNSNLFNYWNDFKTAFSHSILLLGSLWIFVGGFVKIRGNNIVSMFISNIFYLIVGLVTIEFLKILDVTNVNPMYLLGSIIDDVPILNGYMLLLISLVLVGIFSTTFELIKYKKEDWIFKKGFREFILNIE